VARPLFPERAGHSAISNVQLLCKLKSIVIAKATHAVKNVSHPGTVALTTLLDAQ
jgi:hypothetical protein